VAAIDRVRVQYFQCDMTNLLVTRKAAAQILAISQRHLDALLYNGTIPSKRIGRSVRIRMADIEAFAAAK